MRVVARLSRVMSQTTVVSPTRNTATLTLLSEGSFSKDDLDESAQQLLKRHNGKQKREERRGCRKHKRLDIVEEKRQRPHLAYNRVTVSQVRKGLDVSPIVQRCRVEAEGGMRLL